MEQTDIVEIELDTEIETGTEADAIAEVVSDPAAEAFAQLEGEMALMRRAVEHLAARTVGEPTLWEAGTRIMRADSQEAWHSIADAAEMRRDNHEAIDACERDARKANQPVR